MRSISAARVALDINGNGSVVLGPVPAWEVWTIARVVVMTTSTPADEIPEAVVYYGSAEGGRRLDSTYTGNSDTADFATPIELAAGYFLTVAWSGGVAGSTAVAELYGQRAREFA